MEDGEKHARRGMGSGWKFTTSFIFVQHLLGTRHCVNAVKPDTRHSLCLRGVYSSDWTDTLTSSGAGGSAGQVLM